MEIGIFVVLSTQDIKVLISHIQHHFIKEDAHVSRLLCYTDCSKLKLQEREELLLFGFSVLDSTSNTFTERMVFTDVGSFLLTSQNQPTVVLCSEDITFPIFLNRLRMGKKFKLMMMTSSSFKDTPTYYIDQIIDTKSKIQQQNVEVVENELKNVIKIKENPVDVKSEKLKYIFIDGNNLKMNHPMIRNICKVKHKLGDQVLLSLLGDFQNKLEYTKEVYVIFDETKVIKSSDEKDKIEIVNARVKGMSSDDVLVNIASGLKEEDKESSVFVSSDFELVQRLKAYGTKILNCQYFFKTMIKISNDGKIPENVDQYIKTHILKFDKLNLKDKETLEKTTIEKIISLCKKESTNIGYINDNLPTNCQQLIKVHYGKLVLFLKEHTDKFKVDGDYVKIITEEKVEEFTPQFIFEKIEKICGNEWTNRGFVFETFPKNLQEYVKKEFGSLTLFFKKYPNSFEIDKDYVRFLGMNQVGEK